MVFLSLLTGGDYATTLAYNGLEDAESDISLSDLSVSVNSSTSTRHSRSSKKSVMFKRLKQADRIKTAKQAEQENVVLRKEVEVLKSEVETLRRLLRDANTTLSLWIHTHQQQQQQQQQQQHTRVHPSYDHSQVYLSGSDPSISNLPGGPQMDLHGGYFQRFTSNT